MRTKKNLLISMLLKEFKMIFKVMGDMSILVAILSILKIIEVNPQVPFTGLQLLLFAIVPYVISGIFAYLSYRYELRFER
ncbi:MAG: hypothetical protein GY928_15595 [Colwellia sp.]|nr:hypothetical protein [Colwellia sp.]